MGSKTMREGAQQQAAADSAAAERSHGPGKQSRSGGLPHDGASFAGTSGASSGGGRGDAGAASRAEDWSMSAGMISAMGLGGGHEPEPVGAPVQRKAAPLPAPAWATLGPEPGSPAIQRKASGTAPIQAHGLGAVGAIPDAAPSGSGAPLPEPVQQKMEAAFDTSFADVRVHQGGNAAQLGALAYTQGSDLHFAPGQYDPGSESGQKLIGHELTHVVQQRQGRVEPQGKDSPINSDAGLEAEADDLGERAARGESVRPSGATGGGVQRAVIQRKGETLSAGVLESAQQKTIVLEQKKTTDAFNLAHKEGEVEMWVNPTNKSMAQNPKFEQDARAFERRLGQYLANESQPVLGMAAALTTRARAVATTAIEAKHKTARKDLGEWFGSDGVSRIGAVGKDEGVLDEVFAEGNLRERMTVIFNFMWAFSDYLINLPPQEIGKITASTTLDGQSFLNKTAIIKDHALVKRDEEGKAKDKETLTATPDPKLAVGQQYETRAMTSDPDFKKSGLTTSDTMESHRLSNRELRHMFQDQETDDESLLEKHGKKEVPWELGYKRWAMNENHEWVQTMRKLSLPTAAGPSATAWRMVKTAKHLGFTDRDSLDMVRLAAAGYLLTIGAHSLMEVLDGAAPEGVSPHHQDQTVYTNLPPLPTSFLRERIAGGRFPHEPPEDRSLNTPSDQTPQQLDLEQSKLATIKSNKEEPLLPQGTTATYNAAFLNGGKIDADQYRMDWYWIDASQSDTEQPRAVATELGVDTWTHKWAKAGQYKIFCVLYKINRETSQVGKQPSALTPLGVLRFDHGVAPSTELAKKPEPKKKEVVLEEEDDSDEDVYGFDLEALGNNTASSSSVNDNAKPKKEKPKKEVVKKVVPTQKVPMMAWHRTAMDEITVLPVTALCVDEHETGKWNGRLIVPKGVKDGVALKETEEFSADCFEAEPVDAMRKVIELWRQNQISRAPRCAYPQGRIDLFGRAGDEAVREQFFLIGAPDEEQPVRERIPTFRVQGGELGGQNATWVQLIPDQDKGLDVVHEATAWTNFGDMARMIKWLDKRTDRAYCLYMEVEEQYLQGLAEHAIPESVFIKLRGDLAIYMRALKNKHSGELSQYVAEIEDRPDWERGHRLLDQIGSLDTGKSLEEKDRQRYLEIEGKEMSVLMQKADELLAEIERLNALIESGKSSILSSDAATHQYGVTDRGAMQSGTVSGSVRELYQMRTLHLEKSIASPRSVGKPAEDFSSTDYFKMRNIPFIGVVPEDAEAGVKVKSVIGGSPAATAGLLVGDVITKLGGVAVKTVAEYTHQLAKLQVDTAAAVVLTRVDTDMTLQVTPKKP